MSTPNAVIDTNIFISAQRSKRGASSKLVSLIGTERFDIHVSVPLIFEHEEVLFRQKEELELTENDIDDLISSICKLATQHDIHFLWRPHLPDPKDHFVLEVAVAARCEYIVTYNKSDFRSVGKFGIEVVDAREFLEIIGELS